MLGICPYFILGVSIVYLTEACESTGDVRVSGRMAIRMAPTAV